MGIRPLDIQSPISTVELLGRKGRADCEENHNEGNGIGSRSLHHPTYDAYFGLRKSPAQLLMSRRLRSIIPSTTASLQPVLMNPEVIQRRFEEKQEKQKMFYDRNAKTRAGISVGDQILLRKNTGGYQSAVVIEKADTPRSYNVRTKGSAVYNAPVNISRNRDTILVMCLAWLHMKHCGMRSRVNRNCREYQRCRHRINPQKYIPVVPSEVNNLPLCQMSWNQYNAWNLYAGGEHSSHTPTISHDCFHVGLLFFLAINL